MDSLKSGWSRDIFLILGCTLGLVIGAIVVNSTGYHWIVKCLFAGLGAFIGGRAHRLWLRRGS